MQLRSGGSFEEGEGMIRFVCCCCLLSKRVERVVRELEVHVVALGVRCAWKSLTRSSSLKSLIETSSSFHLQQAGCSSPRANLVIVPLHSAS